MVNTVSGVIFFSSIAAARVITLPVEPGSYTSRTDGLRIATKETLVVSLGSNVGAVAWAKI